MKVLRSSWARLAFLAALTALLTSGCGDTASPADKLRQANSKILAGDIDAAIVMLKSTLQVDGEVVEARSLLGQALLAKGEPSAAVVEFRKAIAQSKQPAALAITETVFAGSL